MLSLNTGGDEDGDTKPGLALPEAEAEPQHWRPVCEAGGQGGTHHCW